MNNFVVNSETTERVNSDWLRMKNLRKLINSSIRGLSHKKIPYYKNKIYSHLYDIDRFLTFWMSPFSNFITSYGYYFHKSQSNYFLESELIIDRELVPIEGNWVEQIDGWCYRDGGTEITNSFEGEFRNGDSHYVEDNQRCTELWSDDDKLNFKNIVREYTEICNIDYLQYAMSKTIGWRKEDRDKRIRKGESIISSIE